MEKKIFEKPSVKILSMANLDVICASPVEKNPTDDFGGNQVNPKGVKSFGTYNAPGKVSWD